MTQENLYEFINRRFAELGIGWRALSEAGIGSQTIHNIRHGVPVRIAAVTKLKLAAALKCSIGDINAALSKTLQITPFGEEVQKVPVKESEISVTNVVNKLEELMKAEYPESEEEAGETVADDPDDDEEETENDEEDTLAEFKARMKDMCLRAFVRHDNPNYAKAEIAETLMRELLK